VLSWTDTTLCPALKSCMVSALSLKYRFIEFILPPRQVL